MKTTLNTNEAEEARELTPEECARLGLPVDKSPEHILDEIEADLESGRYYEMTKDEEQEIIEAIRQRKLREQQPAETHFDVDAIPTLQEEEYEDPCPDFMETHESLTEEQQKLFDEWWKRRSGRRHNIFIREMIAHGNRRIAYQAAYPGVKDATARVNACRLMANEGIAKQVREGIIAKQVEEEEIVRSFYKGKLAANNEKRAILAKLMRGELLQEKEVSQNGAIVKLTQKPDFKDILKAIVVDNKMEDQWLRNISLPGSDY